MNRPGPVRIGFQWMMLLTLLIGLSCSATGRKPSVDGTAAGVWQELNLQHDGRIRWFRVYRPADLPPGPAVVVLLHGGTQSMRKIFRPRSGGTQEWRRVAEREKFLLLVPNGTDPDSGDTFGNNQSWNDVRPAAKVKKLRVDDVGFVGALLEWAGRNYPVDWGRIYVTGASNGGMMTFRLLMEMPDRIAAGAAFIANLPVDGRHMRIPERPVPLLICNGTEDPLVRWEGGEIPGGSGNMRSAKQTVAWWVKANRADAQRPESFPLPDSDPDDGCRLYRTSYPPLAGGAVVDFIRMQGGGHTLPSKRHPLPDRWYIKRLIGPTCRDVEGAWLAWEFLKRHRLADQSR